MRLSDKRFHRDILRYALAMRMIAHKARTHTVCEWTGLHPDHVRLLCRSYGQSSQVGRKHSRRGPSPHQVTRYLRTGPGRSESEAMIGVFLTLHVVPQEPLKNPRRELPNLERGERLCKAFELYCSLVPEPKMTLEQAVLLLTAVVIGAEVCIKRCATCEAVMLANPDGLGAWHCRFCGLTPRKLVSLEAEPAI